MLLPCHCPLQQPGVSSERPRLPRSVLNAIKMGLEKYGFKLYALCMMNNHVHYLLEPARPEDLPKIMHWLNW